MAQRGAKKKNEDPSHRYPRGVEVVDKLIWAGYDPVLAGDLVVCKPVGIETPKCCFLLDTDEWVMDEVRAYLRMLKDRDLTWKKKRKRRKKRDAQNESERLGP